MTVEQESFLAHLLLATHDLLDIIDSPEVRGAENMAALHGYEVSETISKRNAERINAAKRLVGR